MTGGRLPRDAATQLAGTSGATASKSLFYALLHVVEYRSAGSEYQQFLKTAGVKGLMAGWCVAF
jgi:hypothetical protein